MESTKDGLRASTVPEAMDHRKASAETVEKVEGRQGSDVRIVPTETEREVLRRAREESGVDDLLKTRLRQNLLQV